MGGDELEPTIDAKPPSFISEYPPGTRVGRYVVIQQLGAGGAGKVYAAYDSELDRKVALKFRRHRATEGDAEQWRARIMREAKAMARVSHPNVVTIYDVGVADDDRIFLAMEVVEGGTLADWIEAAPRGWEEVVRVLCEAGEGLAAAHRAGMIHRDFKLTNVLFGKDGRARVTDFGLARSAEDRSPDHSSDYPPVSDSLEASEPTAPNVAPVPLLAPPLLPPPAPSSSSSLTRLTLTGALMGTPGHMAPEQYTNDVEIDARADVFAFCATLYRALYRERPFGGETLEEIARATLEGKVREPRKGSDVPAWLRKVILSGLATDRAQRPGSMAALLAALRADPRKRRQRWLLGVAAALGTGAVAFSLHAAGERRVRACHAMADRLGGVWDGPRKDAIGRAFHESGVSYADATWARIETRLDAYAEGWTTAAEQACAATRIKGEQSEAMLDLRTSCLDERLDDFRALSDVFSHADPKTVEKAIQAAGSLGSLDPCQDLDRLSAANRLPSEPAARQEIRAVQADIASARELLATGQQTQSWDRIQAVRERVMATKYGPAMLAWTMMSARDVQWHDLSGAAGEWGRAIALAETYRLDREKAESEMRLGRVLNELGRHEDAHVWLGLARATLARVGSDPVLALTRDVYEGWAYRDEAKYADAVRVLEPAVAQAKREQLSNPMPLADAQSFLALALLYDPARFEEARTFARDAVTLAEDSLGPQHLDVAAMVCNQAFVEMETGRLDDALAAASRSVTMFEAAVGRKEVSAQPPNFGNALFNRGEALTRMGRAREGLASLGRGRAIYAAHGKDDSVVETDVIVVDALVQLGELAEAGRLAAEVRAAADKDKETDPDVLVELLLAETKLALERGKADQALARAEEALTLAKTGVSFLYDLSSARFLLSRALVKVGGDEARARSLAEEARAGFAKLGDQARLDE